MSYIIYPFTIVQYSSDMCVYLAILICIIGLLYQQITALSLTGPCPISPKTHRITTNRELYLRFFAPDQRVSANPFFYPAAFAMHQRLFLWSDHFLEYTVNTEVPCQKIDGRMSLDHGKEFYHFHYTIKDRHCLTNFEFHDQIFIWFKMTYVVFWMCTDNSTAGSHEEAVMIFKSDSHMADISITDIGESLNFSRLDFNASPVPSNNEGNICMKYPCSVNYKPIFLTILVITIILLGYVLMK